MAYISEASGCEKCSRLVQSRRRIIFPRGDTDVQVMFIIGHPSIGDEYAGFMFGAYAWDDLRTWMRFAGLKEEDVFWTALIKCNSPWGKMPLKREVETCTTHYLGDELHTINPRYIVCFDALSFNWFVPQEKHKKMTMNKYTNRLYKEHKLPSGRIVIPLPSPAFAGMRGMSAAQKAVDTLTKIAEAIR